MIQTPGKPVAVLERNGNKHILKCNYIEPAMIWTFPGTAAAAADLAHESDNPAKLHVGDGETSCDRL